MWKEKEKERPCFRKRWRNWTDTPTLIPFLEQLEQNLSFRYEKIVADAGYESEENYDHLEENGQLAFIKPINHEKSKTRKLAKKKAVAGVIVHHTRATAPSAISGPTPYLYSSITWISR